jgi:hypothetical protein
VAHARTDRQTNGINHSNRRTCTCHSIHSKQLIILTAHLIIRQYKHTLVDRNNTRIFLPLTLSVVPYTFSSWRLFTQFIFGYLVNHCNDLCSAQSTSHSESNTVESGAVGYSLYAFSFFIMLRLSVYTCILLLAVSSFLWSFLL